MANAANNGIMLLPYMFTRENGPPWQKDYLVSGKMVGVPGRKLATEFYHAIVKIPTDWTVGTGLTLTLYVTDDGHDAVSPVLGLVARYGAAVKKITSGTDTTDTSAGLDVEQTVDITLNATTAVITAATIAIANAALDSAGAGDTIVLRVRRIGTHANDTAKGTAILLGVNVANTAT